MRGAKSSPAPPEPPAPAAAPAVVVKPDPAAQIGDRTKDVLSRFVAWSKAHAGEPCPDTTAIDTPLDPWGHAFRITCSDQPSDQIVGAISGGPDETIGTSDDVKSWQLGRDVCELVRGPRWTAAAPPTPAPPKASAVASKPTAPKRPVAKRTTAPKPPVPLPPVTTQPKKPGKGVDLGPDGLPLNR